MLKRFYTEKQTKIARQNLQRQNGLNAHAIDLVVKGPYGSLNYLLPSRLIPPCSISLERKFSSDI